LVLDKEKNIFVFERNFFPSNEIQKYKLMVIAQVNTGEEITSAILGSVNMQDNQAILQTQSDQQIQLDSQQDIGNISEAPQPLLRRVSTLK